MSQKSGSPTSTNSSLSSASERFDLDPADTSKILAYTYRRGSIKVSNQQELCRELDKDPNLRCSKISIPRGRSRVDVHQVDLYPAKERDQYSSLPNAKNNLASVQLDRGWYFQRWLGKFKHLYIISQETTPDSTPESSQHGSQPNSRMHTFPTEQ